MKFIGTDADDSLSGTEGDDEFDMRQAGRDTVSGLGGNDIFLFGDKLTARDAIDGGAGNDTLVLRGDYSAGLEFTAETITDVESLVLWADFDYVLSFAGGVLDGPMTVDASNIVDGSATIDGRDETGGSFTFVDSAGNDTLIGGDQGDTFNTSNGGKETLGGRNGDDIFHLGGTFTRKDKIDGGSGSDAITIVGDYSGGIVFKDATMAGVETIFLTSGFSYAFTLTDANVDAGATFTVEALALGVGRSVTLDGSLETDGRFDIRSGSGDDVLLLGAGNDIVVASGGSDTVAGGDGGDDISAGSGNDDVNGGAGADIIFGAGGADVLAGGDGADTFKYLLPSDATSVNYDTVVGFAGAEDRFDLVAPVLGVSAAVTEGSLSTATFDADLAAAVDAPHLKVNRAVLFTPDAGDLAGHTFLIIDRNGMAGYQASADIVIEFEDRSGALTSANFI
jgi:Ca2+-binding RTX toxin-like protein